jgi:hypothetical protein
MTPNQSTSLSWPLARTKRRALQGAILAAAAAICLGSGSAFAIEITSDNAPDAKAITLRLSGAFTPGDGLKVRGFVAKLPAEAPIVAHFDVGGGNFQEAMSVGRFLHQLGATTVVPAKARCISPCPLSFLAGADVTGASARIKHSSGQLGFSAFVGGTKEGKYTWKDIEATEAGTQQSILRVLEYLIEVGADTDVLGRFYQDIPLNQVRYMSDDDLLALGVSIFDDAAGELIDARALQKRLRR